MNLIGEMPFMAAYNLGSKAEQLGWARGFKIAAVYANDKDIEVMSFAETVTFNHDYSVGVFDNEKEDLKWLL